MVKIILYVRQQKRHRCIEQSFGLCGRGRGKEGKKERERRHRLAISGTSRGL